MGGAARFVRTLIPRGRYLPFGSCPCRSRGFDTWRPPAVQGHGGFAWPTAEAAATHFIVVIPGRSAGAGPGARTTDARRLERVHFRDGVHGFQALPPSRNDVGVSS